MQWLAVVKRPLLELEAHVADQFIVVLLDDSF